MLDSGIVSYKNDVLKVNSQDLPFINMMNMIISDDNGKPIEFNDEFDPKSYSNASLDLQQICNATTR